MEAMSLTYKQSGVDIEAGNRAVDLIAPKVKSTLAYGEGVALTDLGGFSGAVKLPHGGIIAATTDGVGTKLKLAQKLNKHDTIGIDLVAACANDLVVGGFTPILFQDYIAFGKLVPQLADTLVGGMVEGCKQARVALNGGEMAEMSTVYEEEEYDLAGFAVGYAKSQADLITGSEIQEGMNVYGFPSSGVHANGFGLIYKALGINIKQSVKPSELLWELLTPTAVYVDLVSTLRKKYSITGLVHITGGGLVDNPPRIMPDGLAMKIRRNAWEVPNIFQTIQQAGSISDEEMRYVFNMGLGLLAVSSDTLEEGVLVGEICKSDSRDTQFV